MNAPKISVVLPCYNGASMLSDAIESVQNQTFTDWELIIVNDCSTDNSLEIADSYAVRDERIRVFSNETNSKLPSSLNHGFREAKGVYWTWTSDDNLLLPNMLEEMNAFLDKNPDIGFVVGDEEIIDMQGKVMDTHVIPDDVSFRLPLNCIIGACFMYRAEVAKRIGEYREDLFLAEDFEYFLRLNDNCNLAHLPRVLYQYRDNPGSLTANRQKEIAKCLCQFRLEYLTKAEVHFKNKPKQLALYYYRIVDHLAGKEFCHYFWIFAKRLPWEFGIKYILIHFPHRKIKQILGKAVK